MRLNDLPSGDGYVSFNDSFNGVAKSEEVMVMKPKQHVTSDHDDSVVKPARTPMMNTVHLSASMMFVFMAFSVAQNSQTSISPSVGAISLGILYGSFTLGNTISSYIVHLIGLRFSLFIGALAYAGYVSANIYTIDILLYIVSIIIGVGAAVLWTAQGQFIAQCSAAHEVANNLQPHSMIGQFNGTFFSIFQTNQAIGNLLAALLYEYQVEQSVVFSVMLGICLLGVSSMLMLPNTVGSKQSDSERLLDHQGADVPQIVEPVGLIAGLKKALASLSLLKEPRMLCMLAIILYSGIEQSWMYGTFPPMIGKKSNKFYVLAVLGAMDATSSYIMGKLSDKIGRIPILLAGTAAHGGLYCYFIIFVSREQEYGVPYDIPLGYFFLMTLALAIGDGAFNTQIYSILGTYFKDRPAQAFANLKMFQAGSTALFFGFTGQPTKPTVFECTMIAAVALTIGMSLVLFGRIRYPYENTNQEETHPRLHSKPNDARE